MLDASWLAPLGIGVGVCAPHNIGGVGGSVLGYRYPHLRANLCGKWVDLPTDFVVGQKTQLLGREGAFESLSIGFLHKHGLVLGAA